MASLEGNWNGRLFGTNTGNVAANFEVRDGEAKGEIRFLDDVFGPVVYQMAGTWDGNLVQLKGHGIPADPAIVVGEVSVEGSLAADGRILGRWTSTLGTGGSFVLFPGPTDEEAAALSAERQAPREELHIIQERLGAIRLFREDVKALCDLILFDLTSDRLVVNFQNGATQSVMWSDAFFETVTAEGIPYLKLSINDGAPGTTSRQVIIEFGTLYNEIIVQGESQVWVAGKARVLREFLAKRQSHLVTRYKLWNVNLLTMIILGMIVLMPSFEPLWARAAFGGTVAVVVACIAFLHARFIPASMTSMGERRPSILRYWPQWVSWAAGIVSGLIIAAAGAWIEDASDRPREAAAVGRTAATVPTSVTAPASPTITSQASISTSPEAASK